jgi:hypothetical protein
VAIEDWETKQGDRPETIQVVWRRADLKTKAVWPGTYQQQASMGAVPKPP